MFKAFKELFRGIPVKYNVIVIGGAFAFSCLNATYTRLVTQLVQKSFTDEILLFLLSLTVYTFIWNAEEFFYDYYTNMLEQSIENNTFKYYINKLYNIKPSILKDTNTGYISGLIEKLSGWQEKTYSTLCMGFSLDFIFLSYCVFVFLQECPELAFGLIFTYILANAGRLFITVKLTKPWSLCMSEEEGVRNRAYIDTAININTIQKMEALDFCNSKFDSQIEVVNKVTSKWSVRDELGFMFCKSSAYLFAPIAVFVLWRANSKGVLLGAAQLAFLCSVFIQYPHNVRNLSKGIAAFDRFRAQLSKLQNIIKEDNHRRPLYKGDFSCVRIDNAVYSYTKDEKAITINIPEFMLTKGDKICIHGESGQGKTTLLHLLSQEIENDNVPIFENPGSIDAHKNERLDCVFIAQDTEILDMSLRDNLTLGRYVPDEVLLDMIDCVGMRDWLDSQKDGLDVELGERGVHVSTGQRQRLNLIRGLLISDKEVYLLDEPTSNVDTETEQKIIKLIEQTLSDKTVVIVTHREALMSICNRSYVFVDSILYKEGDI